jgi:hypothetical protein
LLIIFGGDMKIISSLPDYLLNNIRELVEEGKYQSISAFLLIAVENQLTLESEKPTNMLDLSIEETSHAGFVRKSDLRHPLSDVAILKTPERTKCKNIWESWLWGQINRILPIKFAARLIAIETEKIGHFPEMGNFNNTASEAARSFGNYLKKQDEKLLKSRDEKLSTGFPIGIKKEKSLGRYCSTFIGFQRGNGSLTGALFDLGFANVTSNKDGELQIGLTESGVQFSKRINPVIDKNDFNKAMSDNECQFYIDHVIKNVPGETSLFRVMLKLITSGVTKRDLLNQELRKIVVDSDWSDGMISTQRSGAISRMYEIGLITKKRIGLEVRYLPTELGNSFLKRTT